MTVLFRNDSFYGNGGHTPAEILAYETINLDNIWILKDFRKELDSYLDDRTKVDIDWWLSAKAQGVVPSGDENIDYLPYLNMFKGIVRALERKYNSKINYLLWLTDIDNLLELYYDYDANDPNCIDAYETGIEIIHIEGDGNLYAYKEKPRPTANNKEFIKETLQKKMKLLNKQKDGATTV